MTKRRRLTRQESTDLVLWLADVKANHGATWTYSALAKHARDQDVGLPFDVPDSTLRETAKACGFDMERARMPKGAGSKRTSRALAKYMIQLAEALEYPVPDGIRAIATGGEWTLEHLNAELRVISDTDKDSTERE